MRTYEMRVYTLASEEAVTSYLKLYYPNHLTAAPQHDITVHGFWRAADRDALQVHVLFSYPEGADPAELRQRYRTSPEAAAAMPGFDPAVIRDVSVTLLEPAAESPLS